jgi:hypothetical protein
MNKLIYRFAAAGALIGIINNILLFITFSSGINGSWGILSDTDRGVVVMINAVLTIIFCLIILFPGLVSKEDNG